MKNKKYGFWTILMMAITATVGSSILVSFGQVAFQSGFNPLLMMLAWVFGGLLTIPEILLLAEASTSYPQNGTSYAWLKKANWQGISFWFGWILVLIVAATAVATACLALGSIIANLTGIENLFFGKLIGISIMLVLAGSQIFIKNVAKYSQIILTLLKFIPIVLLLIIAMIYGTTENFHSDVVKHDLAKIYGATYALVPASAMTMFAYSGVEAITYVAGEVKAPRKNIPKALITATIFVILLYIILGIGLLTINKPINWLDPNGGFSNVWYYAIMNNPNIPNIVAYSFMGLAILIFIGSLGSFLLYHTRLIQTMAESGDLFVCFKKISKKTKTPYLAMLLLIAVSTVYIIFDNLFAVTNYFIIAVSFLKLITTWVIIYLRCKDADYMPMFRRYPFIFLAAISLIGNFIVIIGSVLAMYYYAVQVGDMWQLWNCLLVVLVLLAGYPVYYLKIILQNKVKQKKQKLLLENN